MAEEVRFLEIRLAVERTCFANFSSPNIDSRVGKAALEMLSGLKIYISSVINHVSRYRWRGNYVVSDASFIS